MDQFIEFAGNHPGLFIALAAISAFLAYNLWTGAGGSGGGKGAVDPGGATELINRHDAVVVDVRAMADFSQGHIINAINIPVNGFKDQLDRLEKYKERPVIVYCRSGAQSGAAVKLLRAAGFEQPYELQGGMMAWQNANLPVSRKKK